MRQLGLGLGLGPWAVGPRSRRTSPAGVPTESAGGSPGAEPGRLAKCAEGSNPSRGMGGMAPAKTRCPGESEQLSPPGLPGAEPGRLARPAEIRRRVCRTLYLREFGLGLGFAGPRLDYPL